MKILLRHVKLAVGLCIAIYSTASFGQFSIQVIPAAPRYQEPVYVRIKPPTQQHCIFGAKVTMVGTVISVQYVYIPELCNYDYDVEMGRFPAGTYTVNVQNQVSAQFTVSPLSPSASLSFPGNTPTVNYSGLWWTPSESGWGLSIAQGATNKLFAVWFVYGPSGEPVWYTLQPGNWISSSNSTTFTGPIYKTTGPFVASTFNTALVTENQVGVGTLTFRYANSGTLSYTVEGIKGTKNIERMIIE